MTKLIDIRIKEGGVRESLSSLAASLEDMSPLMLNISEVLYDATMQNFVFEGRPGWQALSPATIRQRTKDGHWPGRMLQQSGLLLASIHTLSTRDTAIVSAAEPYAAIQQLGGTIEKKARSGTIRLRTNARGQLVRQGGTGSEKNLAVFAKTKGSRAHKRYTEVGFESAAHSVTIPARPYLPIMSEGDLQPEAETSIFAALNAYLQSSWDAPS